MTDEEAFDQYGDEPLYFSHYYNFVFIYKSKELDNGDRIYLQLGGTMEKVSAMSVDVEESLTLNDDAELALTATVESGKGFVLAERNVREEQPIGTIPIDSNFSPVRKVNDTVSAARVGRETDYDRLTMEIWTDGSVSPQDALAFAAKILKDQLSIFINFQEEMERGISESQAGMQVNEVLYRPVDELELSVRSANCLQNADIKFVGELIQRSEGEMLRTKNFGRKSLNEIKEILAGLNLEFGMKLESFPARKDLDRMRGDA